MITHYDREHAARLIPLLRSITREIVERGQSIEALEAQSARDPSDAVRLQAELALHKRELRLAKQELVRLGCALDQEHPLRVLIPGGSGAPDAGYAWSVDDADLKPASLGS